MANVLGVIFGTMLVIALLGALGTGGYMGVQGLLDLFGTFEPQVVTITVIASAVALLCAAIVAGGFKWMGRNKKEVQIRAEKADLYEKILLCWGEVLSARPNSVEPSLLNDLHKLERVLTLRGSPRVLKLYGDIQNCVNGARPQSSDLPSLIAKLALEMRRDLGQSTISVGEPELLTVLNLFPPPERPVAPVQTPLSPVSLGQGG